jgi:hypothetical protein
LVEGLPPGTYTITEPDPGADFALTQITCDDQNSTTELGTRTANVELDPGETVRCVFTNTDRRDPGGALNVLLTDPLPTRPDITWSIDPPVPGCTIEDDLLTCAFEEIGSGSDVEIHVSSPTTTASCGTYDNTATARANNLSEVQASASVTVSCPTPTLIVRKVVTNDNGGTRTAEDFSFKVNDGSATTFDETEDPDDNDPLTGENILRVDAGTYEVTESAVTGYTTTYDNCTDVEVNNGETEICTITNDDIAPTLIIIKHVINNNGGTLDASDFDITVTGSSVAGGSTTFPGAESPGTTLTVKAGTYDVTEASAFADFYASSSSANCSGTLGVGDVKTCTITNDDRRRNQPSIQINSLSISATRTHATGVFNISDESSSGTQPDGFRILLTDYGLRWEFKGPAKKARFQPVAGMTCTFSVESIDAVPGGPAGYTSGDPIVLDETANISYSCTFDPELALHGTLRATAFARIFGRPAREFTFSTSASF